MASITEFLEARIAEDEAAARDAESWVSGGPEPVIEWFGSPGDKLIQRFGSAGQHITNMSPARVLAECAAKRAIIDSCLSLEKKKLDDNLWNIDEHDDILESLAAVYKDHPDYQPEWTSRG